MTLRGDIHSAERAHSEQLQLATAALNSDWQAQLDAAAAGHASQLQAAADETLQQRQKTTDLEQKLLGLEENLADAQAMNRKQSDMLATAQRASDVTAQQLSQEKAERLEYENQVISLEKELCDFQQQVHSLQQTVDSVKDDMTATTQRCDAELAALKASHAAELSAEHERRTELQTQLDEQRQRLHEQMLDQHRREPREQSQMSQQGTSAPPKPPSAKQDSLMSPPRHDLMTGIPASLIQQWTSASSSR